MISIIFVSKIFLTIPLWFQRGLEFLFSNFKEKLRKMYFHNFIKLKVIGYPTTRTLFSLTIFFQVRLKMISCVGKFVPDRNVSHPSRTTLGVMVSDPPRENPLVVMRRAYKGRIFVHITKCSNRYDHYGD